MHTRDDCAAGLHPRIASLSCCVVGAAAFAPFAACETQQQALRAPIGIDRRRAAARHRERVNRLAQLGDLRDVVGALVLHAQRCRLAVRRGARAEESEQAVGVPFDVRAHVLRMQIDVLVHVRRSVQPHRVSRNEPA